MDGEGGGRERGGRGGRLVKAAASLLYKWSSAKGKRDRALTSTLQETRGPWPPVRPAETAGFIFFGGCRTAALRSLVTAIPIWKGYLRPLEPAPCLKAKNNPATLDRCAAA